MENKLQFIKDISIESSVAEALGSPELLNQISNLRQINCFVGSNNSGKSRVIREIFANIANKILLLDNSILDGIIANKTIRGLEKFADIFTDIKNNSDIKDLESNYQVFVSIRHLLEELDEATIARACRSHKPYMYNTYKEIPDSAFREQLLQELRDLDSFFMKKRIFWYSSHKLYIPILRGMRPLEGNGDVYTLRTAKDYKIGADFKEIFTGLSLYYDLREHLLGEATKRKLIKSFEEFLSKYFFENQEVSLIPMLDKDVVYIKIGEIERPIFELGDGVQALIILTFPLFLRKNEPHLIFIEEPELHLHPKWQRFFLKTIKEEFPNHQFFFSTHSNVFLNNRDENISLYHVKQSPNYTKTIVQHIEGEAIGVLEDLGYHASDLFSTNYILWVEGVSDRIYLKKFIETFDADLIEGIHYTIMFYGGCAQLEHLILDKREGDYQVNISSINQNFGFCVDSDKKDKGSNLTKEKKKIEKTCDNSDKFCWITKGREIENLIPEDVWKEAAIEYAKQIKPNDYKEATKDNCIIPEFEDWAFVDLKFTYVKHLTKANIQINVNDKITMAKAVTKIFPKNREELTAIKELNDNIEKLIKYIRKAQPKNDL